MSHPFDCISNFIFVETPIDKADVILIPGGSHPQQIERAAELYKDGYAKYLLPSGGFNPKIPEWKSEWEFFKNLAAKLGVPENAILKEDQARHTFENAELSWRVLQSINLSVKSVILVCKAFHARRALLTYQSVFPSDVKFYISPVIDKRGISKETWFMNNEHINIVMGEVTKIGSYFESKISKWAEQTAQIDDRD